MPWQLLLDLKNCHITDAAATALAPGLALTGGGDWLLPVGIGAGVFTLAGLLTLWFGRRLALHRERTSYVREEDQDFHDLMDSTNR